MIKYTFSILCFIFFITACSVNAPKWYSKTPTQKGFIYASAMATSKDEQIAIDKAELDAVSKLSARINSKIESRVKTVLEESNVNSDSEIVSAFRKEQAQIVDNVLIGYVVEKKFTDKEDGKWKAYVLVKWDTEIGDRLIEENIENKLLNEVRK